MSINNPTLDELLSSPIGSKWSSTASRTSYTSEIQQMMYSFGDYERPLYESAQLVEQIVHQQMTALLDAAQHVARLRGSHLIGLEELLFLMRSDRHKLSRLIKHLSNKDSKQRLDSELRLGAVEEEVYETGKSENNESDDHNSDPTCLESGLDLSSKLPQQTKRVKLCYDFLSSIDSSGALLVVFDDNFLDSVRLERSARIDRLTSTMSEAEYMRFSEARRTSFANKSRPSKFRDWLLKDSNSELKPNAMALEVLQYLAKETVSQIVDLSLLVKQDLDRDVCDPLTSVMPHKVVKRDFPLSQPMTDSEDTFAPYPSPNSPFLGSSQKNPLIASLESHKSKKRKRNDNSMAAFETKTHCITPNQIREAIRRYYSVRPPLSNCSTRLSLPSVPSLALNRAKLLCL